MLSGAITGLDTIRGKSMKRLRRDTHEEVMKKNRQVLLDAYVFGIVVDNEEKRNAIKFVGMKGRTEYIIYITDELNMLGLRTVVDDTLRLRTEDENVCSGDIIASLGGSVTAALEDLKRAHESGLSYEEAVLSILHDQKFTLDQAKIVLSLCMASFKMLEEEVAERECEGLDATSGYIY